MTKVFLAGGQYIAYVKGATEVILPRCTTLAIGTGVEEVSDDVRGPLVENAKNFEERGTGC